LFLYALIKNVIGGYELLYYSGLINPYQIYNYLFSYTTKALIYSEKSQIRKISVRSWSLPLQTDTQAPVWSGERQALCLYYKTSILQWGYSKGWIAAGSGFRCRKTVTAAVRWQLAVTDQAI